MVYQHINHHEVPRFVCHLTLRAFISFAHLLLLGIDTTFSAFRFRLYPNSPYPPRSLASALQADIRPRNHILNSTPQSIDYDKVDWDERWDEDLDRDAEERWFDDEEED